MVAPTGYASWASRSARSPARLQPQVRRSWALGAEPWNRLNLSGLTMNPPVQVSDDLWLLSWTSTWNHPFRVYRDGLLVSEQDARQYLAHIAPGESPIFEVLDNPALHPSPAYPPYLFLGWKADSDAVQYRVEENVASVWTLRALVTAQAGEDWLTHATGVLVDETQAEWRVIPVDAAGNQGTAKTFTVLMVRYPDPPSVTFTYNAGTGAVTLAAS
jgi:hypothetical protein